MFDGLSNYFHRLSQYDWWVALLELAVIAGIYFVVLRFLRDTRGARLFNGVLLLLISSFLLVNFLAEPLGLNRLRFLFERFAFVLAVAVVVVFQPELRRAFMAIGAGPLPSASLNRATRMIDELVSAAAACSARKIGMIVAIQRNDALSGIARDSGVAIDAAVTQELLLTIFHPNTPLHDMGVVIMNDRIAAARVQFEQAEPGEVKGELGARHRAAVGLTQTCDALVVVVSEETGVISVAEKGKLRRPVSPDTLRELLRAGLGEAPRLATPALTHRPGSGGKR